MPLTDIAIKNIKRTLKWVNRYATESALMWCSDDSKSPIYTHSAIGIAKRTNIAYTEWTNDEFIKADKQTNTVAILCADLVVLDIDSEELYDELKVRFPLDFTTCTISEKTRKGYHFFYKRPTAFDDAKIYDKARCIIENGVKIDLDIKTICSTGTRGVCVISPSPNKEWITAPWDGILTEPSNELSNWIIANYDNGKKEKKKLEDKVIEYKVLEKESDYVDNSGVEAIIKDVIQHIKCDRAKNFDTWSNMCWAVLNVCRKYDIANKARGLIHTFSAKSDTYDFEKVNDWLDTAVHRLREEGYGMRYIYQCLEEDDKAYYEQQYGKTYAKIKMEIEKELCKIRNPVGFLRYYQKDFEGGKTDAYQILSEKGVKDLYRELAFWEEQEVKGVKVWKKIKFIDRWLDDIEKRVYERMVFDPTDKVGSEYYNVFSGYRAKLIEDEITEDDMVGLNIIRQHIFDVICDGVQEHFEWFEQWMANIIQRPKLRSGVCIVVQGKQGCGKNTIIDAFANGVLGKMLSFATANPSKDVFGNFNSSMLNKLLLICNEIGNDIYTCMDKIKDLTTDEYIRIEKKGKDIIPLENYVSLIMTTNNTNPLNVSLDDRRIVWFLCNNKYKGDTEYFNTLYGYLARDSVLKAWYEHLRTLELTITSTAEFQDKRPKTKEYKRVQRLNLPSYIRWLSDSIGSWEFSANKRRGGKYYCIQTTNLYKSYMNWCQDNRYESIKRDTFVHHMTDRDVGGVEYKRDNIPTLTFEESQVKSWLANNGVSKERELDDFKDAFGDDYMFIDSENDSDSE